MPFNSKGPSVMQTVFQRYATPFITGFFFISLISGIGLFFHFGPSGFREMHEWLSIVLIVPFGLHLWKNWRPMVAYFKNAPMVVALVISAIAAGVFLIPSSGGQTAGGPPQFQVAHLVMSQPAAVVAPVLGLSESDLEAKLAAAGFAVTPGQSLADMAVAAGKTEADVAAALIGGGE
jgi:hypothetical protein